ncbi:MAG TPA: hypothetical protein VN580_02480 [Clostridia bacterium]|nr:hypothetical protein [Clostridia bacterium]
MSNAMKTVTFIVSLFVFLFFFIAVNYLLPPLLMTESPYAGLLKALIYAAGYIAAMYSQAFIKHLYTKNAMKGSNVIKVLPVKAGEFRALLIALVLPLIAVMMPMVSKRKITGVNLRSLAFLLVLAAVIQLLFLINNKSLKLYVTNKGFAVDGTDLRLELTIPFSYTNAAGWYPFERIENYLTYGTRVTLYQTYDMGMLSFECSEEETRQIKGLLVANGIPERRY